MGGHGFQLAERMVKFLSQTTRIGREQISNRLQPVDKCTFVVEVQVSLSAGEMGWKCPKALRLKG